MEEFSGKNSLTKILKRLTATGYVVKKAKSPEGINGHVVSHVDKYSYIADQFKILRNDVYFLSPERSLKTIMITSSRSQEGRTVVACNLAVSISSDAGKKTVLVDADFRKPEVHKWLNMKESPGFTDLIDGNVTVGSFLQDPVIGNLYVIPAGTPCSDPAEKLDPERIKQVIEDIKQKCDYAVFDTSPVLGTTDASVMGPLCDGVLLVVKANVTPKDVVKNAYELLNAAQARPVGCILTNTRSLGFYGDYYQGKADQA